MRAVHADEMDDIEIILRVFDAEEEYGPCSRIRCALALSRPSLPLSLWPVSETPI